MPERTLSLSREKDSIHSGISLQKGAFIVHYGFRSCNKLDPLLQVYWLGTFDVSLDLNSKLLFRDELALSEPS